MNIQDPKIQELIEQAHMNGQRNSTISAELPNGIDPSYSEAFAYYKSLLPKSNDINLANEKINLATFESILPGAVFAHGVIKNSPDGLYMTNTNIDKPLLWIAKKGSANDWAIYTHWESKGFLFVLEQGDKVNGADNIKKLVNCDPNVLKLYRF